MGGCVWVEESFLRNDKWQMKLLSQLILYVTQHDPPHPYMAHPTLQPTPPLHDPPCPTPTTHPPLHDMKNKGPGM